MVIAAVFYIPTRLGGWGRIFGTAQTHFAAINPATKKPFGAFVPTMKAAGNSQLDFATLAPGSALTLFLYPHSARVRGHHRRRWRPPRSWPSPRRTCSPATRDPGFPVGLAGGQARRPGADETRPQEYTANPAKPPSPLRLVLFMIKLLAILIR